MEITFTQEQSYSLTLNAQQERELSDVLDIPLKEMRQLVESGYLLDDHHGAVTNWINDHIGAAELTEHGDIEIDQVTV